MKYSIVIATHNAPTTSRHAGQPRHARHPHPWEVIVVDNNCTDDTPGVVRDAAVKFPVPLRYAFESVPGRCAALNTGIAITAAKSS
jgi:glycosyltransferase involved in cell wall biosynthesis